MAKSKRKSGSSTDVSRWETELNQVNVNEDDWKALIVFVVPDQPENLVHISIMSEAISSGIRKLFSNIDYDYLLKEVKDLAQGKSMKGKIGKPPQFVEIVDQIKNVIDHGEEISPSLLAKLLKFKLLLLKQKDLERREEEKKAAETAAKQAKQDNRSRAKTVSSQGKRSKSQSPSRKKGKKDDAPASPKKDTKLKKRGNLDEPIKILDDEPDGDGCPSHYVIIHGIHDARVFKCLMDLGVTTDAIIRVNADIHQINIEPNSTNNIHSMDDPCNEEDVTVTNDEKMKDMNKLKKKLEQFWKESETFIQESQSGSKMKDIANLAMHVDKTIIPDGNLVELQKETKNEFGTKLFDLMANACYELLTSRHRYQRYLRSTQLTHVLSIEEAIQDQRNVGNPMKPIAEVTANEENGTKENDIDLRYYQHLVDQVPCESQSVGFILDSLLKQVDATLSEKNLPEDLLTAREDFLDNDVGEHLDNKLRKLGFQKQTIEGDCHSDFGQSPTVLKHGDETSYRLFHLSKMTEIDLASIESEMNRLKALIILNDFPKLPYEEEVVIRNQKQQLYHFCLQQHDIMNIDKLLTLLCLESLDIMFVDPEGKIAATVKESARNDGENNPNHFKQELDGLYNNLKELLQQEADQDGLTDQQKNSSELHCRKLENYCYSEHFDKEIFVQILHEALELRPCVDSYYHHALDRILLVLHNPKDFRLSSRSTWSTWLHSNVGFRNYLDFVAQSINQWHNEEDIKEEASNQPLLSQTPEQDPTPNLVKTTSRHVLKKREEIEELKAAEDEKNKKKGKKSRSRSGSPNKRPPTDMQKHKSPEKKDRTASGKKRTPSARKAGSRMGTGRKQVKTGIEKKFDEEPFEAETKENIEKEYRFHGYDIGDDLVHVSGEKKYLFPQDGSLVKIEKTNFVNGNVSVRTAIYKDKSMVILHLINPLSPSDRSNICENVSKKIHQQISDEDEDSNDDVMKLFSNVPDLPELPVPVCQEACLSLTLDDGLQIGIAPGVRSDLFQKYSTIQSKINQIRLTGTTLSSFDVSASLSKGNSPKGKRKQEDEAKRLEEIEKQNEIEMKEKIEKISHDIVQLRNLNLSRKNLKIACPHGLHVFVLHAEVTASHLSRVLYIKQEYPFKSTISHPCEKRISRLSAYEQSRIITMDGSVVKFMQDGSTTFLLADGSVCTSHNEFRENIDGIGHTRINRPCNNEYIIQQTKNSKSSSLDSDSENHAKRDDYDWCLINSKGERFCRKSNGTEAKLSDIHMSYSLCPKSSQVMESREDGTIIIRRPDGARVVEHNDGTRITTFTRTRTREKENETGEEVIYHPNFIECIKIECEGFATVLINKIDGQMQLIFGDGTRILSSLTGNYKVSRPDSSKILVNQQGDLIYVPKNVFSDNLPAENIFSVVDQGSLPTGMYLFRNSNESCFSTVDCDGNKFTVSSSGEAYIDRAETNTNKNCGPVHTKATFDENDFPRYFVVRRDGGGEELLHESQVSKCLEKADKDPTVAVLKSNDFDENSMSGITLLRPIKGYQSQIWFKHKDEKEIIPRGLKEREFKTFPASETAHQRLKLRSKPDVPFQVGTNRREEEPTPAIISPSILNMRHFIKFNGLSDTEREKMLKCLENYHVFTTKQFEIERELLPVDLRSQEEKLTSADRSFQLSSKFKELKSNQNKSEICHTLEESVEHYMKATAPPATSPSPKALPQRSQAEWEKDRIQIAELMLAKDYLRFGVIPPYFDTEDGQSFLYKNYKNADVEQTASNLAKETLHPSIRPISVESNEDQKIREYAIEERSFAGLHEDCVNNPTPAIAIDDSQDARVNASINEQQRPYNPTPMKALASNENNNIRYQLIQQHDKTLIEDGCSFDICSNQETLSNLRESDLPLYGGQRKLPLKLPNSIEGSRPGALPNERFAEVEEPVRRKIKTASIAGSINQQSTANMRGFNIIPDFVDFGVLKEGMCYSFPVFLHNVGVDSCRFKIRQAPPSTGITVRYKAGSVAAGMQVRLDIEIFAIAVGVEGNAGVGSIGHHIEIATETDIIYLPVTASILTAFEFEDRRKHSRLPQPSSGVVLLTAKPTSREELTRPRKT